MQQWEYKVERIYLSWFGTENEMNEFGSDSWELVGVYSEDGNNYAVYKRPVEE